MNNQPTQLLLQEVYTMLDATGAVNAALAEKLSAIPAVIRVRIL